MSHDSAPAPQHPATAWPSPGQAPAPAPQKTEGFAIAALVLGILGVSLLALVFGFLALGRTKRNGTRGRGLAIAGIVLGAIWIAVSITLYLPLILGSSV